MFTTTYVIAAYGRRYTKDNIEKAKSDWDNGKDFKIVSGPYCSRRDFSMLDTVYVLIENKPFILE